ncbi:MAG: DUF427 domain-containing protein [Pseudomonadales bacterium]|nr:DUF427 domain-containing protein [Pseudomonadales bacterium]
MGAGAWAYDGRQRPPFAQTPGPGQRSVWDFPRPPALIPEAREGAVFFDDLCLARSKALLALCETASPPAYYFPEGAIAWTQLIPAPQQSFCEWKGPARYFALKACPEAGALAWTYPEAAAPYGALAGWVAFYAQAPLRCRLGDEWVAPQPGSYYGGWVTEELVGPFKDDGVRRQW